MKTPHPDADPIDRTAGNALGGGDASRYVRRMNFDDAFDSFERDVIDAMHEELAQGLADEMREMGRTDADGVELSTESDTDDPKYAIDAERVRRRANEILAGG